MARVVRPLVLCLALGLAGVAALPAPPDETDPGAEESGEPVEAPPPAPNPALTDGVCYATPREGLIEVVGPTAGRWPVWMVDSSDGRFRNNEAPEKTVWVVARDLEGELHVTVRRLDGSGQAGFRRARRAEILSELRIPYAHREDLIPGKAPKDVRKRYAFHGGAMFYPSPGCYEFTATYGGEEVIIVVEMTRRGDR